MVQKYGQKKERIKILIDKETYFGRWGGGRGRGIRKKETELMRGEYKQEVQ